MGVWSVNCELDAVMRMACLLPGLREEDERRMERHKYHILMKREMELESEALKNVA